MTTIKATNELFVTDGHFPDVSKACWQIVLEVAKSYPFDLIWCNGDWIDGKAVSKFLTNPNKLTDISDELASARQSLRQLREAAPNAKIIFREGNHDRRIQRYIHEKAPELAGLRELELPNLLRLAEVECKYLAGDDRTKVGELYHIHGDEVPTGRIYPARAALSRVHSNIIFGHVHRFSVAYESTLGGKDHVAWSIGCLQNLKVDYSFHPEWQQGFAIINYTRSGRFNVSPVPIFRDGHLRKAIIGGKLYQAA